MVLHPKSVGVAGFAAYDSGMFTRTPPQFHRQAIGAICTILLVLPGCVTSKTGEKKFDPLKAAVRADSKIDDWLEGMGYPTSRH